MKIEIVSYSDLTEEQKAKQPNNGHGKEDASYVRISHKGKVLFCESDAMEPEDAIFCRDLNWIVDALGDCYQVGYDEGYAQRDSEIES